MKPHPKSPFLGTLLAGLCLLTFATGRAQAQHGGAPLGHTGAISGTVTWKLGQIPETGITSVTAYVATITPSHTPGHFGTSVFTKVTKPPVKVTLGPVIKRLGKRSQTYTAANIPIGTPIAIGINATPFGRSSFTTQFQRDGNPQFATCGQPGATVANFNFHFVPAP